MKDISTLTRDSANKPIDSLESLLALAINKSASDIHLQPQPQDYRIRLRVDGMLHTLPPILKTHAQRLITRLKIMAHLDLADTHLPQDGQFQFQVRRATTAFRLNICPGLHGEHIALRQLEATQSPQPLEQLGLDTQGLQALLTGLNQPQGLILMTGPTGSGKTTSLYASLQYLQRQARNILTIEDPVESPLEEINQFNVNPKTGLTTLTLLRALLRQDPDVIMLGEIRDREMLSTVVQASHTGHLVLSSLHTHNTIDTITRLSHMGMQPYHLAHTLNLVVAQRLLRQLCPHCKQPSTKKHQQLFKTLSGQSTTIYQAVGCKSCTQGYQGRRGIFEVLVLNDTMREAILSQGPLANLRKLAEQSGWISLEQAAFNRVAEGQTSLTEIHRVCDFSHIIARLNYPLVY